MPDNFRKCRNCGRIYTANTKGQTFCIPCQGILDEHTARVAEAIDLYDKKSIADIAGFTNLREDEVKRVLKYLPSLAQDVDIKVLCVRCRRNDAVKGTQYCFNCRIELSKMLNVATQVLSKKVEPVMLEPIHHAAKSVGGVMSAFDDKHATMMTTMFTPPRTNRIK